MKIRCKLDGTIIVYGVPSRRKYEFTPNNNHTLPIDIDNIWDEDIPDLLSKKRAYRACCQGSNVDLDIFEVVG